RRSRSGAAIIARGDALGRGAVRIVLRSGSDRGVVGDRDRAAGVGVDRAGRGDDVDAGPAGINRAAGVGGDRIVAGAVIFGADAELSRSEDRPAALDADVAAALVDRLDAVQAAAHAGRSGDRDIAGA